MWRCINKTMYSQSSRANITCSRFAAQDDNYAHNTIKANQIQHQLPDSRVRCFQVYFCATEHALLCCQVHTYTLTMNTCHSTYICGSKFFIFIRVFLNDFVACVGDFSRDVIGVFGRMSRMHLLHVRCVTSSHCS